VDVVAGGGLRWIKVKAMNPVNMDILTKQGSSSNKGRTTQRSITELAQEMLSCAKDYPYHFQSPQIIFNFTQGVTYSVASALRKLSVKIMGPIVDEEGQVIDSKILDDESENENESEDENDNKNENNLKKNPRLRT